MCMHSLETIQRASSVQVAHIYAQRSALLSRGPFKVTHDFGNT